MKHYQVVQGSEDWLRLRMGRPTASEFDKIITAKKWEPTKGETRRAYAIHLLTELILDMPLATVTTAAMESGKDWEPKARAAYEMMHGVEVQECGFCTNDEGTIGASPDGFVGDEGSIEIKCPFKPDNHVAYMLSPDSFVEEYFVQTQGQLYVTGRKWTDVVSYFGGMPMLTVRVVPNPTFQDKLDVALRSFTAELSDLIEVAVEKGWLKERPIPSRGWIEAGDVEMVREKRAEYSGPDFLADADLQAILKSRGLETS